MISIRNLTKIYDNGICPLKDLSLDIEEGKRTVILGPSGCGKTTLLRMIAGLESKTYGEIDLGQCRSVSMVFQDLLLFDRLTAFENIAYGADMRKIDSEKILSVSKMVKTDDFLEQITETLSGGQKQRVALARALMKDPDLLLMDEALNSLDAVLKKEMIEEIISLQENMHMTLIYVTHDRGEAKFLADTVIELPDLL
jgi:ABC-type Fe3+/spermidine/putrescine transport system ATPase subunit